jgi:hypothetical protein
VDEVTDILAILKAGKDYEFDWPGTEDEARKYIRTYILTQSEPFAMISRVVGKGCHCKVRLLK